MHRKYFNVFALLVILSLVLAGCAQPIPVAPSAEAPAASGETASEAPSGEAVAGEAVQGGVWTRASASDADIFNPLLTTGTNSADVEAMMYAIGLVGRDVDSGALSCDTITLCESWEVSDDGLIYTFHLKDGLIWSDGTPIDANTFKYTYDAVASPLVDTTRKSLLEGIGNIEVIDPQTVVVTYDTLNCTALGNLGLPLLPSHVFAPDFSDIMTSPENHAPTVVSGPFAFQSWERDDNIILVRNENYVLGAPNMDGMIFRVVPDAGARFAMLQSGESDIEFIQPNQISALADHPQIQRYTWDDDGFTFLTLNNADPAQPVDGQDADGNLIPQPPHPILGDKRVRQAIAQAIDYDAVINDIYFGQGRRQVADVSPAITWAYNDELPVWNLDLDAANALLDEAGWVDSNGDGIREKDGMDLVLRLRTNAGNTARENLGVYVQDALSQIGISVDFQAIDFGTLLEVLYSQDHDMIIIGFTNTGTDPDSRELFGADADIVGSGFNFFSFQNEQYEELSRAALQVVGCGEDDMGVIYKQIQEIIREEVPAVFITASRSNVGYNQRWLGIEPRQWSASSQQPVYWNVEQWSLSQ